MITRFAPSPTGPLHLGHAYSARLAFDTAVASGGTFLLRIDDVDRERSKEIWEEQILKDLAWLGMHWPEPVLRQSSSAPEFEKALRKLHDMGLTYPCSCTRADIAAASGAPQEGHPTHGPDGAIYPGTCRGRAMRDKKPGDAIRLDVARAVSEFAPLPTFLEIGDKAAGLHPLDPDTIVTEIGDVVLARRSGDFAYHLAVVVDDANQGITHVIRGEDLFDATPIHVLLQHLLGFPHPTYLHHKLIRDDAGRRLAKRDDARAIRKFRDDGLTPRQTLALVGP